MQKSNINPPSGHLIFLRHGATEANLAGLRCGGDLDLPLTDFGRRQAAEAALRLRELRLPVGLIVTSALQRTRETADITSRILAGVEVLVVPAFAERRLGVWNHLPVSQTESAIAQGLTPPGGESNQEFMDRIGDAMASLLPRLEDQPLLVGSKGVARVIGELLGLPARQDIANGQLAHFDLGSFAARHGTGCPA